RPQKRCCGSAFAFSPIRVLSSCTPIEVFVISSVPLLVRGTSTSRAPLHAGARTPVAAPLQASVAPRYRRFFAPTDPAATLRPSAPLPTPTLLRGLSPRDREGFTSFDPTLRCVLPSLPRRNRPRLSASVLPRPMLPSPFHERLGFRTCSHGACSTFDACGPQRRFPALQPDLSGGTTPCFRHSNVSPQLHGSLAVTVSRFSLAGLHRLSSGHAVERVVDDGRVIQAAHVSTACEYAWCTSIATRVRFAFLSRGRLWSQRLSVLSSRR